MNSDLVFRLATREDLGNIIKMLSDDALGTSREKVDKINLEKYINAFETINNDPNQELTVVELNGETVGIFQLTLIQYLTYQGGLRMQVEAVRTSSKYRGRGIGSKMFAYILNRAKEKGCHMVQLTSDKKRTEAIKFYEKLGFVASHEGMKFKIEEQ